MHPGRNAVSEFVAHASRHDLEVTFVHFLSVTNKLTKEVVLPMLNKIRHSGNTDDQMLNDLKFLVFNRNHKLRLLEGSIQKKTLQNKSVVTHKV